jgi:hypothetical protein
VRRHGTRSCYQGGCRCRPCTDAKTGYHAKFSGRPRALLFAGLLAVECWCHAEIVFVEPEVVRAGRTGSCGSRACKRMEAAA